MSRNLVFRITSLESLAAFLYFLLLPHSPKNAVFLGFSLTRLGLMAILLAAGLFFGWLGFTRVQTGQPTSNLRSAIQEFIARPDNSKGIFHAALTVLIVSLNILVGMNNLPKNPVLLTLFMRITPVLIVLLLSSVNFIIYSLPKFSFSYTVFPAIAIVGAFAGEWFGKFKVSPVNTSKFILSLMLLGLGLLLIGYLSLYLLSKFTGKKSRTVIFALLLLFLGIHYYITAVDYAPTNRELNRFDQKGYVTFTIRAAESGFTYTGERNFMPLYPYLQAILNDPQLPREEVFERGKIINIQISLALLVILFFVYRKIVSLPMAVNLILITAFSWFIYKSVFFKVELLFYFLSFLGFLLMGKLLHTPSWWAAGLAGFVWGLAYLTKASAIPALFVFICFYTAKQLTPALRHILKKEPFSLKPLAKSLSKVLLVIFVFILVVSPYIIETKTVYGQYFYHVTNFVFWSPTWPAAKQYLYEYGARYGPPTIPLDQLPTVISYLNEQSFSDIVGRMNTGLSMQADILFNPYGQFNFLLIFSLILLAVLILKRKTVWQLIRQNIFLIGFAGVYIGLYFSAYAWYIAILIGGDRFTYSLFIPFLVSLAVTTQALLRDGDNIQIKDFSLPSKIFSIYANMFVFILLTIDIFHGIPVNFVGDRFGW